MLRLVVVGKKPKAEITISASPRCRKARPRSETLWHEIARLPVAEMGAMLASAARRVDEALRLHVSRPARPHRIAEHHILIRLLRLSRMVERVFFPVLLCSLTSPIDKRRDVAAQNEAPPAQTVERQLGCPPPRRSPYRAALAAISTCTDVFRQFRQRASPSRSHKVRSARFPSGPSFVMPPNQDRQESFAYQTRPSRPNEKWPRRNETQPSQSNSLDFGVCRAAPKREDFTGTVSTGTK